MEEEQLKKSQIDMKSRVMNEIKKKRICISSPSAVLAKKLGLECAMVAGLLGGAFLMSIFFFVLKKTGVMKFLLLGFPGLKVFLLTIPYGKVALFIGILMLTLYFSKKLDLCYQTGMSPNLIILALVGVVVFLMVVFILADIYKLMFKGLGISKIPKEIAIDGRIKSISLEKIVIEEEDGQIVELKLDGSARIDGKAEDILGKHLRAVGIRDPQNSRFFHAQNVLCCDND
ncbi:MAG TPA: hypothetical protein P5262_03200 [Candidatus Moranbacteria bacterium]|nr:hypothetical protein [Candidatus Moranbacteria bacterium]